MTKTKIILFSLGLVLAAVPLAFADSGSSGNGTTDAKADCEEGQDWAGYSDDPLTTTAHAEYDFVHGLVPVTFGNCEGEQWDGQDSVHPENGASQNPGSCAPDASSAGAGTITDCYGSDPNVGGADVLSNGKPVAFRISESATSGNVQLYVMVGVTNVGHTGVYQGLCTAGSSGLEGASSCSGDHVQDRTAWYGNDDTPSALLASVVTLTITKGFAAADSDCSQADYEEANAGGAPKDETNPCHRDNTAITADLLA